MGLLPRRSTASQSLRSLSVSDAGYGRRTLTAEVARGSYGVPERWASATLPVLPSSLNFPGPPLLNFCNAASGGVAGCLAMGRGRG